MKDRRQEASGHEKVPQDGRALARAGRGVEKAVRERQVMARGAAGPQVPRAGQKKGCGKGKEKETK
jgi:hypothetical protein